MIDLELTAEQKELQNSARNFALTQIAPYLQRLEDDLSFRQELFDHMAKEGYFQLGRESGIKKSDTIGYLLALKEIARIDAGIAVAMAVTSMVAETITREGTTKQKQKYLETLSKGEGAPFSFALTESNAGSDAQMIETSYKREKNGDFILNGSKKFITNADMAGVSIVMAKSFENASLPQISAFLVDRALPGFSITKKENKLGLLTANLVSLKFDACRLPSSQLLGKEGDGFKMALKALDGGRLSVAAQALGIAESAFESAKKYALQREQFGGPIIKLEAIAFKLADMHVKLSAGELLLLKAAWKKDQGLPYTLEASEAKLYCSEAANQIADEALQIHGGYGYIKDYPVEKYFRDARVTTIYEGTSEIQRLIIARHIAKS